MAWIILIAAGLMEAAWAVALSRIAGVRDVGPIVVFAVTMMLSMVGLAIAMRSIPIGTAYAVWTGIGAVTTAAVGMLFLHEPVSWLRVLCLALIVGGVAGLHATSTQH